MTAAGRIYEIADCGLRASGAGPIADLEPGISHQPSSQQGWHAISHQPLAVSFRHVSFSYSGEQRAALHDVSFDLLPGQTVALVGPSGGGKTTLVNLICRFYDVLEGAIRVDGTDVRDYDIAALGRVEIVYQLIDDHELPIVQVWLHALAFNAEVLKGEPHEEEDQQGQSCSLYDFTCYASDTGSPTLCQGYFFQYRLVSGVALQMVQDAPSDSAETTPPQEYKYSGFQGAVQTKRVWKDSNGRSWAGFGNPGVAWIHPSINSGQAQGESSRGFDHVFRHSRNLRGHE